MIKTTRIVRTLCLVSTFLICMAAIGVIYIFQDIKIYFSGIELFFTHCYTLELFHLTITAMIRFVFPFFVGAVMLSGFIWAVCKGFLRYRRYSALMKNILPARVKLLPKLENLINKLKINENIILFDSDLNYAFNSGILKPSIYISNSLVDHLSEEELTLVVLHEKCHIKNRDCLKMFCTGFMADWLYFLPIFRWLSGVYYMYIEKKTDDSVVKYCGNSMFLASILLKISKFNKATLSLGIGLAFVDKCSFENRLRYLIDKEERISFPKYSLIKSALIAVVLFLPIISHVFFNQSSNFTEYKNTIDTVCAEYEESEGDNHHENGPNNHSLSEYFKKH